VRGGDLNRFWRMGLLLVGPIVHAMFRVRVAGIEHVPSTGAAILVFNHVSALDGPVLAVATGRRLRRETRFLVAAEFLEGGPMAWVLRNMDQIPIRRGEGDAGALDAAIEVLREGGLTALAPEGTVDGGEGANGLQRLRSGLARIALPTGAPIIPVGIWGTQARYPKSGFTWRRPLRPRLAIAYGPPLLPWGSVEDPEDVETLLARARLHLEEQVERARRLAGAPT
jgi:1-acyl-sn-glycerol-3-phosphate acyltransferase